MSPPQGRDFEGGVTRASGGLVINTNVLVTRIIIVLTETVVSVQEGLNPGETQLKREESRVVGHRSGTSRIRCYGILKSGGRTGDDDQTHHR